MSSHTKRTLILTLLSLGSIMASGCVGKIVKKVVTAPAKIILSNESPPDGYQGVAPTADSEQ